VRNHTAKLLPSKITTNYFFLILKHALIHTGTQAMSCSNFSQGIGALKIACLLTKKIVVIVITTQLKTS